MRNDNPYAPSPGALTQNETDRTGGSFELASRGRRFANLFIDFVACVLLSMLVGVANVLVSMATGLDLVSLTGPLVPIAAVFGYYLVCEAVFGKTVGKLITRTEVVAADGARAKLWQLFARTVYRFMPMEAFSFLSSRRLGWHDRWSGTRVINARRV